MALLARARRLPTTRTAVALVAGSLIVTMPPPTAAAPEPAVPAGVVDGSLARSPELSETTRLQDRRALVTGTRAWAMGTADGRYPAAGFHTRGEMGGFWLPNLKLLDGMWFGINDALDRSGHHHHLGLGLRPHRPPRHPGRLGQPHRRRAGREERRTGRAEPPLRV